MGFMRFLKWKKKNHWIEWKQPHKLKNTSTASTGEFLKLKVILYEELWIQIFSQKGDLEGLQSEKKCWIEQKQPRKLKNTFPASTSEFLKLVQSVFFVSWKLPLFGLCKVFESQCDMRNEKKINLIKRHVKIETKQVMPD